MLLLDLLIDHLLRLIQWLDGSHPIKALQHPPIVIGHLCQSQVKLYNEHLYSDEEVFLHHITTLYAIIDLSCYVEDFLGLSHLHHISLDDTKLSDGHQ